jgi:hypothetical protein
MSAQHWRCSFADPSSGNVVVVVDAPSAWQALAAAARGGYVPENSFSCSVSSCEAPAPGPAGAWRP